MNEYVKVCLEDLDRIGVFTAEWRNECIAPMQYLLNIMSMIPKEQKGDYRMIAAMATGWRMETKLDRHG